MRDKILTFLFVLFISIFMIINIIIPDSDISNSERRKLTNISSISLYSLVNGEGSNKIEKYVDDQFVFRDYFRNIKSNFNFSIYNKLVSNGLMIKNDYIYSNDYIVNMESINYFNNKINNLYDLYLDGMNVYYTIIPDKNYYSDNYLKLDYDKLYSSVKFNDDIKYIDIRDCLDMDSYYYTDSHYKQDKLFKVRDRLASYMEFDTTDDYQVYRYSPFYGVYYGQLGLNLKSDEIVYLSNSEIENSYVYNIEKYYHRVYDISELDSMDSYSVYLSGGSSLITITNNDTSSDKELIMFRDSYGSSLAPLLIHGYKKITLVDLRYINMKSLGEYIYFNNQDVLIMYGVLVVNKSYSIK